MNYHSIMVSHSFTNAKKAILDQTFNQLTSVRVIRANLLDKFFRRLSERDKDDPRNEGL